MPTIRKKVLIRTIQGELHAGYLAPSRLLDRTTGSAFVPLLSVTGRILSIPLESVYHIAFVRDFNLGQKGDPEGLSRNVFLARPRAEGLWVRLTFHNGKQIEGLAALDLSLLDDALDDRGLFLTPPDVRSNTQRLFIPRSAIGELQLIAVVKTPSKPKIVKSASTKALIADATQDLPFPVPSND